MCIEYILLTIFLIISIICIVISYKGSKKWKIIEEAKNEELKDIFKERWDKEEKEFNLKKQKLDTAINGYKALLVEKEKRYEEVNQDLDLYRKGKIEEIDSAGAEYEKRKQLIIDKGIEEYRALTNEFFNSELELQKEQIEQVKEQKEDLLKDIETVKAELEVERSKRAAINEEIRKQEEKEKYNENHSVQLTDNEKEDIHFLLSLEDRLHNKQPLYKLIWSTYLQQAYKDTFHNILGNRNPKNVIYCIENINTGKKYIGKTSAEVSKRWTEHIKTSLNIGAIKTTNIHKALYNHWDEFIFYILAETEKEKLSEMEKYYIRFYESDKYGYNIKAGG